MYVFRTKQFLTRSFALLVVLSACAFTLACENPAANKPAAGVTPATPETPGGQKGGEVYPLSSTNSKIAFVGSKVTGKHEGFFEQFTGEVRLSGDSAESSSVTVEIDMSSVKTDSEKLTEHLKSADFFDVARFPKATFSSNRITANAQGSSTHTVAGNFELHGEKRQIAFPALITLSPDELIVQADFSINRKDFGIVYAGKADDLIRDEVLLQLSLRIKRGAQ